MLVSLVLCGLGGASAAPYAYITNSSSHDVSVIDTATNTVTATVPVGVSPYGVAVNPAGTRVYVGHYSSNAVPLISVIDTANNTVTATVPVGSGGGGVAVNPVGSRVYVANRVNNNVSVIDTTTNTVTATVPVGSGPFGVAVNPAGNRVYVANQDSNNVSVIDTATNTVTATVPVGTGGAGVAVSPAGSRVYVANLFSDSVSVIDTATNTVTATVPVGRGPFGVAVNPAGTRVFVTNSSSHNVSVIDTLTNSVIATVPVELYPAGVAVNTAGTRVYVPSLNRNNVSVIDIATNSVTGTPVPVGVGPIAFGAFISPAVTLDPLSLSWPTEDSTQAITQDFACRGTNTEKDGACFSPTKFHTGLDIKAQPNSSGEVNVHPAAAGIVCKIHSNVGDTRGLGHSVVIRHPNTGLYTLYAHLKELPFLIRNGVRSPLEIDAEVSTDDIIGYVGGTGYGRDTEYEPHLHFEVKRTCNLGDLSDQHAGYAPRGNPTAFGYLDPWSRITGVARTPVVVKVVSDTLNVRHGPATSYPSFTEISMGQRFVAYAKRGNWYRIALPCSQSSNSDPDPCAGWINASTGGAVYALEESGIVQYVVRNDGDEGIGVMSAPSAAGTELHKVWDGQRFVAKGTPQNGTGCNTLWYSIDLPSKSGAQTGWVCGDYIYPIEEQCLIPGANRNQALAARTSVGCLPGNTNYNSRDFNSDGKSDLVWQNTSTGDRYVWFMNGASFSGGAYLGGVATEWSIAGTGDFNGDAKPDIVWQNTSTGDRYVWFMNGVTFSGGTYLGGVPTEWSIAGIGDFNGDAKPDIVWQNASTGDRYVWFMNGTTFIGDASLGIVPTVWSIAGTGDFNGDGKTDILWQNTVTGDRYVWFMNGATVSGGAYLGFVPTEWSIAGTGDFNGDAKPDIVWQNASTGDRYVWFMNGVTFTGGAYLGGVPTEWRLVP